MKHKKHTDHACSCGCGHDHDHSHVEAPLHTPEEGHDLATASLSRALTTCFTVLRMAMLFAVVLFFLRGLFYVETGSAVLIRRFGDYIKAEGNLPLVIKDGGSVHYAIPIIEQVERVSLLNRSMKLNTAFMPARNAITAVTGGMNESLNPAMDGYTITGDTNIMHSQWEVSYKVDDSRCDRYLLAFQDDVIGQDRLTGQPVTRSGPEHLLEVALCDAVIRVTAGMKIDHALNEQISSYIERVRNELEKMVNPEICGLQITGLKLNEKSPPDSTKAAFTDVSNAMAGRATMRDNATGEGKKLLNEAESQATQIVNDAIDFRSRLIADTGADAENLTKLLNQCKSDPGKLAVYIDQEHQRAIQQVLARTRKYLIRPGQTWLMIGPSQEDLLGSDQPNKMTP